MSHIDTSGICPYTGLRSFTEEESLYFKGRDLQVDQVTALLEQNKFLMVTGASGEGKSSLIYAGLIPNARAGFFRAKYTNWVVADFRPERNPVKNMAKAIAEKFGSQPASVETELRRGFSSLVDLYTNSDFYTNEEDDQWRALLESEKKDKKRKAANLLILVDQFEEFFTNPENFFNETPSQDSQIVVNLILETARIAMKKNLPVYIVCTMRSDYIGQCSAFRGLPEYIGFSQFFVPRLKRKDLKQVIEEPAILSGNRISQRLIERLVFDLSEGVDQLPILQHALNQVWLAANHGQDEMDLLHYAMVGGMPATDLPDHDQQQFETWLAALPEQQREYYHNTGLSKVIELHASILYDNAWIYYNKAHPQKPITQEEGKRIIRVAFTCLTKIDNSRAVRNRMSLAEITEIVSEPGITDDVLGGVLDGYREEGNSFLRPFKTNEDPQPLAANTVLDITHESLIRNWTRLNKWANQEFDNYSIYLDFKKQLDRWKSSGKSSDYLLPIGPLSYFEDWNTKNKPNAGWIKRYDEASKKDTAADAQAASVLSDVRDFLKRSARHVVFTRTFVKYGPQRLAILFAGAIMLIASGFYWYDAGQKKNIKVIENVRSRANTLLASPDVGTDDKSRYLIMEERYAPGSLTNFLNGLPLKDRVTQAIKQYTTLLEADKKNKTKLKHELITLIAKSLQEVKSEKNENDFLLTNCNKFNVLLSYDNYYNSNDETGKMLKDFTLLGYEVAIKFFTDKKLGRPATAIELNLAIQYWLTFNGSSGRIAALINLISPLAGDKGKANFDLYYSKGNFEPNGRVPIDYNGGYHTLACLYAAMGDEKSVLWAFDEMIANNQKDYFGNGRLFNNYTGVIGYLYAFGHQDKAAPIVAWLGKNDKEDNPYAIYRNAVIRSAYIARLFPNNIDLNFLRTFRGYYFPTLCFAKRSTHEALVADLDRAIEKGTDLNQRHFLLAMSRKREGIYGWKYRFDRGLSIDYASIEKKFDEAIAYYHKVDNDYLKQPVTFTIPYASDGVREKTLSRRQLFIYPDYMDGWFSNTYHSDVFFNYLFSRNILKELYVSGSDLEMLQWWLAKANENTPLFFLNDSYVNKYRLPDDALMKLSAFIGTHPARNEFDETLLNMVISNRFYDANDTTRANEYGNRFDKTRVVPAAERYGYLERNFFYNELLRRSVNLAKQGKKTEAVELAERFPRENEKAFAYLFMAKGVYRSSTNPDAFVYLDSTLSKIRKTDIITLPPQLDPRFELVKVLSQLGSDPMNRIAFNVLRDYTGNLKVYVIFHLVDGLAAEGNYYRAYKAIPSTFTESAELQALTYILWEACKNRDLEQGNMAWEAIDKNIFIEKAWSYVQYFQPF